MRHAWGRRLGIVTLIGVIVISPGLILTDRALGDRGDEFGALGSLETEQETALVLHVANNGVDTQACGAKDAPCRSISQAIANAKDGDRILVGPGRYGDLNGNGSFSDSGDESAELNFGCVCMIKVNKSIQLKS